MVLFACHRAKSDLYYDIYYREKRTMTQTAKLFINGRSQAVRLPAAYRFNTKEVFIHQDPETGDVILSRKPADWGDFFVALKGTDIPHDFLSPKEREQSEEDRDPFKDWKA